MGTLLRRELDTRAAAANGDIVTPVPGSSATQEWEWARAWTVAPVRFLLPENRGVIDDELSQELDPTEAMERLVS